jgi:hypothetical protein
MEIKRIARFEEDNLDENLDLILDNDLDNELSDIPEEAYTEEEEDDEDFSSEDMSLQYIDPKTGLDKLDNSPTEITANDGMTLLSGTIKVAGFDPEKISDSNYKNKVIDAILDLVNLDHRVFIDKDSLVTTKLEEGLVSFLISPTFKTANTRQANAMEIDKKVTKVYNDFFNKIGDPDDADLNAINKELYELAEKVSFLDPAEKLKLRNKIRQKLSESGITLTYIEVNR